jgi:hypothetical protein
MLRAPGSLYSPTPEGRISNLYTLTLRNKTKHELPMSLRAISPDGASARLIGFNSIAPETVLRGAAIVEVPPERFDDGKCNVVIGLYSGDKLIQKLKTRLIGPMEKESSHERDSHEAKSHKDERHDESDHGDKK